MDSVQEQRTAYERDGFVIVSSLLAPDEVTNLRTYLSEHFKEGGSCARMRFMMAPQFIQHEPLYSILFRKRMVETAKALMGDSLAYNNDFSVQCNAIGWAWPAGDDMPAEGAAAKSWHADAGSEFRNQYLWEEGYRYCKCGIYLQDADNQWGGGIYVAPGSHRWPLEAKMRANIPKLNEGLTVEHGLNDNPLSMLAPLKAGDALLFDSRLYHSSSLPAKSNLEKLPKPTRNLESGRWDLPEDKAKFVIYWDLCNEKMLSDNQNHNIKRALQEEYSTSQINGEEAMFSEYLSLFFPRDYPADFVSMALANNIRIGSLPFRGTAALKAKLNRS